jgi:hypothetical protein
MASVLSVRQYLCNKMSLWILQKVGDFYNSWANISFSKISYFFYNRIRYLLIYFMKYLPIATKDKKYSDI